MTQEAFDLAVKHVKGDGVEKDMQKAMALFTQAATAGHSKAQFNLGLMYANGIGVKKDQDQAINWLTCAVDQGHMQAVHALAKEMRTQAINAHATLKMPQVEIQPLVTSNKIKRSTQPKNQVVASEKTSSESSPIATTSSVANGSNAKGNPKTPENIRQTSFIMLLSFGVSAIVTSSRGWTSVSLIFLIIFAIYFITWKNASKNFRWPIPATGLIIFLAAVILVGEDEADVACKKLAQTYPNRATALAMGEEKFIKACSEGARKYVSLTR